MSPALLARCVRAWIECHTRVIGGRGPGGTYSGPTPDEILREAGIDFDRDRELYHEYERAIRAEAWARLGGKVTQGSHNRRTA